MNWRCIFFGHKPERIAGLFYVSCSRCTKVINLFTVGR